MWELISKLVGDGKNNVSLFLFMVGALYIGKMQIDHISAGLEELKQDQKQVTRLLVEHAATWSKIADRVKVIKEKN